MSWPWETRTSTCRNFATISSGLYRFLAIAVLLDVETYLKSDHFVGGGSDAQQRVNDAVAQQRDVQFANSVQREEGGLRLAYQQLRGQVLREFADIAKAPDKSIAVSQLPMQ